MCLNLVDFLGRTPLAGSVRASVHGRCHRKHMIVEFVQICEKCTKKYRNDLCANTVFFEEFEWINLQEIHYSCLGFTSSIYSRKIYEFFFQIKIHNPMFEGERVWVDHPDCKLFVDNILTGRYLWIYLTGRYLWIYRVCQASTCVAIYIIFFFKAKNDSNIVQSKEWFWVIRML